MKALILSASAPDAPSAKRRIETYARHLRDRGVEAEFAALSSKRRGAAAAAGAVARLTKILGAGGFDVVVVHRRLLPGGDRMALKLLERAKVRWVYDVDDALHLAEDGSPSPQADEVEALAAGAALVLADNETLAAWARGVGAKDVRVQPTPVDTDVFHPPPRPTGDGAGIVGWIGTPETSKHLRALRAALGRLGHRRRYALRVVGAGAPVEVPGVNTVERPFDVEDEAEECRALDVGLRPCADDERSRSRSAYDALAFMASGAAPVVSPVGAAAEIVAHGVRGFHARTDEEWVASIDKLLSDPELRVEMSVRGRAFVEEKFSVRALQGPFADALFAAAKKR